NLKSFTNVPRTSSAIVAPGRGGPRRLPADGAANAAAAARVASVRARSIGDATTSRDYTRRGAHAADAKSDPRILGRVGRLGARRNGFVHLRARPRPRTERTASTFRQTTDGGQHRLLRKRSVRALPRRVGTVDD